MGEEEIAAFLSHLAIDRRVAASTQNQAFSALLFLYQHVLDRKLESIDGVERVRRPARLPVVFTKGEARAVLAHLKGDYRLMAHLLYGSGLRLLEAARLRIKDIDFSYNRITILEGKGQRSRITILPARLKRPLQAHLARVHELHRQDLARGRLRHPDSSGIARKQRCLDDDDLHPCFEQTRARYLQSTGRRQPRPRPPRLPTSGAVIG